MSTDQYILSETADGSVTVNSQQSVIASFPAAEGGIGPSFVDIIPVRNFLGIQSAIGVSVDNQTEHGIYIPGSSIYVPPYTTGFVRNFDVPITQAYVRAKNDSVYWQVPAGGETCTITFSDKRLPGESSGTPVMAVQTSVLVIPSAYGVNGTSDPQGLRTGLDVAIGYDLDATENGNFQPQRTPNLWIESYIPTGPNGFSTIYTAPPGNYYRLLHYEVMISSPTGAYYYTFSDGTYQRMGNRSMPFMGGGFASSGPVNLPGNGLMSTNVNDVLKLYTENGAAYSVYGTFGLYVGP